MSQAKNQSRGDHTPGPWQVSQGFEDEDDRWIVVADGPRPYVIAMIHNGMPGDTLETEGVNAKLMAAAPELKTGCLAGKKLAAMIPPELWTNEAAQLLCTITTALSRAEGE